MNMVDILQRFVSECVCVSLAQVVFHCVGEHLVKLVLFSVVDVAFTSLCFLWSIVLRTCFTSVVQSVRDVTVRLY